MTDRVQKLEALLERVRNRSTAPRRASAGVSAPLALEGIPPAAASAPFAPPAATPPLPPVAPAPTPPAPPTMASAPSEAPAPTTPGWQPEPGSAVQSRPGTLPPESMPVEEISDDDLLEVTTIPPDAAESVPPAAAAAEATFAETDEPELTVSEPPRAERPLVEPPVLEPDTMEVSEITAVGVRVSAATLDEALASAAELEGETLEGEREVPIKTPPPESGPQEALPPTGLEAGRTPNVDDIEADLLSPPSMGPTAEQLGETIELEAPRGPELEIDVTVEEAPVSLEPAPAEELEVALPRPSMQSGLYDVTAPPPAAYPDPSLAEGPPSIPEQREMATIPVDVPSADSPARTARPALGATDVAHVALAPAASSRSFVELLDASLLA